MASSSTAGDQEFEVTHDREQGKKRFLVTSASKKELAYVEYELTDENGSTTMDLFHTYTDPAARGKGLAGKVVKAALEFANESELKVNPS